MIHLRRPKLNKELFSHTRKIVLVTGKIHLVSQEKIISLSNRKNISCDKAKCDRKNTSGDKRSIIFFTKGIFPVKGRIFLVTGNLFPVTGVEKNTSCHRIFFL